LNTLYIRLPSKAAADASVQVNPACPFALAADNGAIKREGVATLANLGEAIREARRVVMLLAAGDVTLLQVKIPPLSGSRLKAALPGLIEDQLMADPSDCVIVAGGTSVDGLRTVAVVQRNWLEHLATTLYAAGARQLTALPAQLCLPYEDGAVAASAIEHDVTTDVAIRLSPQHGIGLSIVPERPGTAANDVIQTLRAIVPGTPIALYVSQSEVSAYRSAIETADARMTVFNSDWTLWIINARSASLNLMSGLVLASRSSQTWRAWRWPLRLAAAIVVVNLVALNVEWWRAKREADTLRTSMIQTYKTLYPNETAIIDPIVQIRRKITAAQRASGQAAPDDFTALVSAFGDAWIAASQGRKVAGIASLEYRDGGLIIRFKTDGETPQENVRSTLAARNLVLTAQAADVWQIRGAK
jgi:general secretion pathway protein L